MSLETNSPHEQYANEFDAANKNEAFEEANRNFFEAANKQERLMKEYNLSTEQLANPESLDIPADKLAEIQEAAKATQEANEAREQSVQK